MSSTSSVAAVLISAATILAICLAIPPPAPPPPDSAACTFADLADRFVRAFADFADRLAGAFGNRLQRFGDVVQDIGLAVERRQHAIDDQRDSRHEVVKLDVIPLPKGKVSLCEGSQTPFRQPSGALSE